MPILLATVAVAALPLLAGDGATRADWPTYGGTYSALRYSALDQINRDNVRRLARLKAEREAKAKTSNTTR